MSCGPPDREHRARLVPWAQAAGLDLDGGPLVIVADVRGTTFPEGLFTAAELARAARFRAPLHRDEYLGARAVLRRFLGPVVGLEPAAIRFEAPDGGKPGLVDRECAGLDVSVSHSGGRVACGFVSAGRIGVDLEALGPRPGDLATLARRTVSPAELDALAAAPAGAAERLFLHAFTRKEAVLKAAGLGLSAGTRGFDVVRRSAGGVLDVSPVVLAGRSWTCESLAAGPDVELAVAWALE